MSIIGKDNFSGGVSLKQRVSEVEAAVLARCSGYDARSGHLEPEKLCSRVSATAITGVTPEQVPFAFVRDGDTRIICRDADEKMRECISGVWSDAGSICDVLVGSVPVRMGEQVIFPTGGPDPKLMVYEPGAPAAVSPLLGTKLRPLSLKAPTDYASGTKATITASVTTSSHTRLFDCEDANAWASPGTGCTEDNTGTDVAVLTLASTSLVSTQCFTKSLAVTPINLTGKVFLVMDLMITGDTQAYDVDGLFVNDAGMFPSGYVLTLYSDAGCTTPIAGASFHIPKLTPLGKVNRVVFNLGTLTATCQGIAISTESFYTPPLSGSTYSISVYSEDFLDDWGHKGNFVLPAVQWDKSPWAAKLTQLTAAGDTQMVDLPTGANLVTNPGFEDAALAFGENTAGGGWTIAGGGTKVTDGAEGWPARNGGACIELDNYGSKTHEYITRTSGAYVPIEAGREYNVGCYFLSPGNTGAQWRMTVTYKNAIGGTTVGTAVAFPSDSTYYSEEKSEEYRLKMEKFTVPTGTGITHFDIMIEVKEHATDTYDNFRIDDVFCYAVNQATQGSAIILQRFSPAGTDREPGNPKVRYAYCFGGKDLLGVSSDLWKLMVSNPSSWATDDAATFADPWRTYAVAIILPSGPLNAAPAVAAGGTGYAVNDILAVNGGDGGKVKVATLSTTAVATVTLLKAGTGYTDGAAAVETTNETDGTATGCTLNLTASDAMDEYGDYLLWFLIYRQLYDPDTKTWYADVEGRKYLSEWGFANYVSIGATATYTDKGVDAVTSIQDVAVPKFMELTNNYAASARHVAYKGGRVQALGANWDNENARWASPTAIQISSDKKPWAFPATNSKNNDGSEGTWYDNYAVNGAEGRGLIVWRGETYVFLDNEFFILRGDNSLQGWFAVWVDSVGLKSALTLAGGRRALTWHDGHHFQASQGGPSVGISRDLIDSTLIDWTEPHGAVHFDEQYVFLCKQTDGEFVRMVYDLSRLPGPAWRVRYSDALEVVGITTDGQDVYGVTPSGDVVNIFGSLTTDYGAASVVREVWTQFLKASGPSADAHVGRVLFDIITEEAVAINVALTMNWQGAKDGTQTFLISGVYGLTPDSTITRYDLEANGQGDAFQLQLSYTGTTAPDIYAMAFERDDVPAVL